MNFYGADIYELRTLARAIERALSEDWERLLDRVHAELGRLFWFGPDRELTRSAVQQVLAPAISAFLSDVRLARSILEEAIRNQEDASNVSTRPSGPGTPFGGPGQLGLSGPGTPFASR